ncbi:MAG: relaxase/mobilization nuclease domain-containing protein [Clostridia bacterium]|nr:relaxase/mobilization nuclease domain-containing protein [Clostridia bacterium]
MATVNYIRESKQTISAMKGLINYCVQDLKVKDEQSGRRLVSGVNCNGENAFNEFMTTKYAYKKVDGFNFYQYVQSFHPSEKITPEQVHKIGLEFAEKAWPGHEVLVATHLDAEHIHNHFVINSVSFESGYKLRQSPTTLKTLRCLSDNICADYGLSVLRPYEQKGRKISSREYRARSRGSSWKQELITSINHAMFKSGTREEFIEKMKELGFKINWKSERKYLTFTCPGGQKCRDIRLHNNKFLKETLETEFRIRGELLIKFHSDFFDFDEAFDSYSVTGWEESRKAYFSALSLGFFENEQEKDEILKQNYFETFGLGARGVLEFANIFDDTSEDSEECRKRREAEENGANLGAIIGIAAGLILNLNDDNSGELPQELEEEQNEIWLQM